MESRRGHRSSAELSRRRFLGLMGAGAASALLASCLPGRPTPGSVQGQPAQLVYQDWRTDWFPGMAQEMLAQFHAQRPDIRVFYVPDPVNVEEQLPADMRNGNAPDVFAACCAFFPIIGQQGYALDLRSFMDEELDQATIDDWDAAQVRALATREGVQFGLPKYHGALALYYNKDLFDPTTTWMPCVVSPTIGTAMGRPTCGAACSTYRGSVSRSTSMAGEGILSTQTTPRAAEWASRRPWRLWSGCARVSGTIT